MIVKNKQDSGEFFQELVLEKIEILSTNWLSVYYFIFTAHS